MDPTRLTATVRRLEPGGWVGAARAFASRLRSAPHQPGRLLVVGTPDHEPWHLVAHLDELARWRQLPELAPVLVRRAVPVGAPAHLSVALDAVGAAGRGATVLVTGREGADDALLDRLDTARSRGASLFTLGVSGPAAELATGALELPGLPRTDESTRFEIASHLLPVFATASAPRTRLLRRP